MLIEARLDAYCEAHGIRAVGQAGFRKGRGCSDHVFVLKRLIDSARAHGSSGRLFACFVDFKKAYDLVRRDLLMKCLADIGLRGEMLTAICSMYWKPSLVTAVGRDRGQPFECVHPWCQAG